MRRKIIEHLKKPYPITSNKWIGVLSISIFIPLFLILFEPFGIKNSQDENKYLFILFHGLATFAFLVFNVFVLSAIFKTFFSEKQWTVLKQIFWFFWNVITIGVANYILAELFSPKTNIKLIEIFSSIIISLLLSIIPVAFLTILTRNQILKKNLAISDEINKKIKNKKTYSNEEKTIVIYSENKKNNIETTNQKLLFIESVGNYITVWYVKDDKTQSITIRNTLKNISKQINGYDNIIKVHRAFIVNIKHIENIKGNSQGYKLKIKHLQRQISVSRNYINELRKHLKS